MSRHVDWGGLASTPMSICLFYPYSQIIFDGYGKLTGAQIKTFLLEKVRVVKHSAMERNYHIFYMLAAGAPAEQREGWAMGDLESHQFTSQSGCYDRRDGVLDSDLYEELIEAFRVMGFEETEKASGVVGRGWWGAIVEACGCVWWAWGIFGASCLYQRSGSWVSRKRKRRLEKTGEGGGYSVCAGP